MQVLGQTPMSFDSGFDPLCRRSAGRVGSSYGRQISFAGKKRPVIEAEVEDLNRSGGK
jgi:hypothetical protein